MDREEAKLIIAKSKIKELGDLEVSDILSEYCGFESVDEVRHEIAIGELPQLKEEAIVLLGSSQEIKNPDIDVFEELILDYLTFDLKYSKNSYLEEMLARLGKAEVVDGEIPVAGKCPCCGYLSIDPGDDGLWEICKVCFWENGGDGPNKMSLAEAKENFLKIGAINENSKKFVDPDGKLKYEKA